jgi:PAS domain S-box-containing protein
MWPKRAALFEHNGFVLAALSVLLAFGIGSLIWQHVKSQRAEIISQYRADLLSIADLKVRGISAWLGERRTDANAVASDYFAIRGLAVALDGRHKSTNRSAILQWLNALRDGGEYEGASLLDGSGAVLLTTDPPAALPAEPEFQAALSQAIRNHAVSTTKWLPNGPADQIHEDILVPLFSSRPAELPIAVVVFRVRLDRRVKPWLRDWSVQSRTGECVLFHREGDTVAMLSEPRFFRGQPLRAFPLSSGAPAALGVLGFQGVVQGKDYRGVPVLAAVRPVPDTDWVLVVKMDLDEILAPLRERTRNLIVTVSLMLTAFALLAGMIWRHQKVAHFRELYQKEVDREALRKQAEVALKASESMFRSLAESVPAAIWMTDAAGKTTYVNQRFVTATGLSAGQAHRQAWLDIIHPEDRAACLEIAQAGLERHTSYEIVCRNRNTAGEYRWILNRATPKFLGDGRFDGHIGAAIDITERKQTEDRLRQLSRAVEQSPAAVVITDLDGSIQYVNPKFTQITGYSAGEVAGKDPRILNSGETPPEVYREIWETILAGREWRGEFHNKRKNGELYWVSASISVIADSEGAATHFLALQEDITGWKRAQAEASRSAELARHMIDSNLAAVAVVKSDTITDANDAFLYLTGCAREDVLSLKLKWTDTVPPEYRAQSSQAMEEMLRIGVNPPFEMEYCHQNGRRVPVLIGSAIIARQPLEWICFILDLTNLKRSQKELRRIEAKYRRFVETAADGILEVDTEGRVVFANARMADLFGYSVAELVGESLFQLTDQEHVAVLRTQLDDRRRGQCGQYELKCRRKDGTAVWGGLSGSPLYDANGCYSGAIGLFTDLTARKKAEEELTRANRELRLLSREALHSKDRERRKLARDLHDGTAQLLTGINMNIGRLANMISDGEQRQLLAETMALSKECAGEVRTLSYGLHPPLLDELGLVTAVQSFGRGFGERAGLDIDVKVPADFGRLDSEMELALFRIIQEAIMNVHRHSGSPRAVIELGRDSQEVRLTIRDFGRGTARPLSGSSPAPGVGLLGMRERAQEFGGDMNIESTPNGTMLTITLPLAKSNEDTSHTDR